LDLGCGYGGRTVFYAREGGTRAIHGLDITDEVIRRCRLLAAELDAPHTQFEVGRAEHLPYPAASFDLVLSYDVLEHVDDPRSAMQEIARVLRPGGEAWLVFPTYLGALSAHLDYLTRLPALHRIFDPETIIDVVNEFLVAEPERLGVAVQPRPRVTPVGREVLPSLNGMNVSEALQYVDEARLEITFRRIAPIFHPFSGRRWARALSGPLGYLAERRLLPDLLVWNIALGLRRPY
jgi:SAM-dependent methyltransferase